MALNVLLIVFTGLRASWPGPFQCTLPSAQAQVTLWGEQTD